MNAREMPIAFQLPDWNSWLPTIHPLDAFGSTFSNSTLLSNYNMLRSNLVPGNAQVYKNWAAYLWIWLNFDANFLNPLLKGTSDPAWNNPTYTNSIYSIRLWTITKQWEVHQEFGLEGMAPTVFGAKSDPRAWFSSAPFQVSPNMIHIPTTAPGLANGQWETYHRNVHSI